MKLKTTLEMPSARQNLWPMLLGWLMLLLTYLGALLLLLSDSVALRVGGGLFFAFKGLTWLVTFLAVLVRPRLGWRLFVGRYRYDSSQHHFWRAMLQAFTRFWWELPQLWAGYMVSQWRVIFGQIDRVESLGGVTFAIAEKSPGGVSMGMSLGPYVNIWLPEGVIGDFDRHVRLHSGQLLMHEFGHTVDSMRWGWLYVPVIGLPSLLSQWVEIVTRGSRHQHRHLYAERWANRNAQHYFGIKMRDLQA